jgi:hypothetical protein
VEGLPLRRLLEGANDLGDAQCSLVRGTPQMSVEIPINSPPIEKVRT